MATNIRLKSSSVSGKTPSISDLSLRELAVNTVDGKLFLRKGTGIGTDTIVDLTNHSTFSNLANDDHTQYLHATTTRTGVTAEFNTTGKITTTNNVGVGITNPAYKLDVLGDINFTGTLNQNGSPFVASRWTSGTGDNIYRLLGNVGIGTTNPTSKLHVSGGDLHVNSLDNTDVDIKLSVGNGNNSSVIRSIRASDSQSILSFNINNNGLKEVAQFHYDEGLYVKGTGDGTTAGNAGLITFSDQSGTPLAQITSYKTGVGDNTDLIFSTYDENSFWYTEKLRITANGNIGVGTDSPSQLLHLESSASNQVAIRLQNSNTGGNSWLLQSSGGAAGNGQGQFSIFDLNALSYRLVISSTGNVGIGTTNPTSKLHTIGTGLFENDGRFSGVNTDEYGEVPLIAKITSSSFGNTFFGAINPYNYPAFAINVDGYSNSSTNRGRTEFFDKTDGNWNKSIVLNTGRVGIGTTNPRSILSVNGYITESTDNGVTYHNVVTQQDIGFNPNQIPLNQYLGQLAFMDAYSPSGLRRDGGGADDVVVNSSGFVGIGTSVPTTVLDVNGNVKIGSAGSRSVSGLTVGFTSNTQHFANIDVGDSNRYISIVNESATLNAMAVLGFRINPDSPTTNAMLDMKFVQTGIVNRSALHYTFNHNGSFVDRLTILSSGNVGIGTTNPSRALHVSTTGVASALLVSQPTASPANYDSSEIFNLSRTTADSNICFSESDERLLTATITPTNEITWRATKLALTATNYISLKTNNGTEAVRIDINQNVGIGTANPTSPLHVQGSARITGSIISTNYFTTTSTGSVTGGVAIPISTISATSYRSVEYIIQAVSTTNHQVTKLLLVHDGTNAYITEYGSMTTNAQVSSYVADISGGNIVVTATPTSVNATNYKVYATAIAV